MFKKLDHVVYFVNDVRRARKFYTEVLGLPILMDTPGFVKIGIGDQWLGLHPSEMKGADVGRGGMIYLAVEDLRATLEELRRRGVRTQAEPSEVPSGLIATILDVEGNAVGLFQAFR
jgi:predicted enzyme related to lactoylglutathione lyase